MAVIFIASAVFASAVLGAALGWAWAAAAWRGIDRDDAARYAAKDKAVLAVLGAAVGAVLGALAWGLLS